MTRTGRVLPALFVANAAAVVLIWWAGLEPHALETLAGRVNAAGRITALFGTYLLFVQLILRTHVPWLVSAFGKDALKAWHTKNAYVAVGLIAAHVVLQTAGYALADRVDAVGEVWLLLTRYEGMVLAFAAIALLGVLTLLALDQVRHRISWPLWRALHLYTYAALALSVPHIFATGGDFLEAPVAVAYWTALEVVVVAILLAARIPPIWRSLSASGRPHPATVAVAAAIVAIYLAGSVRLSDAPGPTVAGAVSTPPTTARPSPSARATSGGPVPAATPVPTAASADGLPIETQYGTAQVRVILEGGRIVDVEPLLMPSATKRSRSISNSVEPWLLKRAIAAQSAQFDVLSGATYTSRAYMESLDSALRAAGVAHP